MSVRRVSDRVGGVCLRRWEGGRWFHSQHRTPVVPQVAVQDAPPATRVHVGYLLHRSPVVKHAPHPVETEMAYLVEREHQRYSRHEGSESATHFFAQRGQPIDLLNRTDPNQIKADFFGLEPYQDAMKVVLQRLTPEKRVTAADLWQPDSVQDTPPVRHTLQRKLDDYLYLIIRDEVTGKWTVPQTLLNPKETLRMAVDRGISTQHNDGLDCYVWSNAPQATVYDAEANTQLFVFSATYLAGRPSFATVEPKPMDHAWATRRELRQYGADFTSSVLLEALLDISADSTFEA